MAGTPNPARVAATPVSWGVTGIPGLHAGPPPAVVLRRLRAAGLTALELGPDGFLPRGPALLRRILDAHGARLLSGFVSLTLHEGDLERPLAIAAPVADAVRAGGGSFLVVGLVDEAGGAASGPLGPGQWRIVADRLAALGRWSEDRGLRLLVHPHTGTLVERPAEIEALTRASDVWLCCDTGHVLMGGWDPVDFVERFAKRIGLVHLKDVRMDVARRRAAGELSLAEATRAGMVVPLGQGDARIDEVLGRLADVGYDGWLVVEQPIAAAFAEDEQPAHALAVSLAHLAARLG